MRPLLLLITLFSLLNLKAQDTTSCTGNYDSDNRKHGKWVCRVGTRVVKLEKYKHGELQTYILYNDKGQAIETRNRKGKVRTLNPCGC